jgi:hypothetical protein
MAYVLKLPVYAGAILSVYNLNEAEPLKSGSAVYQRGALLTFRLLPVFAIAAMIATVPIYAQAPGSSGQPDAPAPAQQTPAATPPTPPAPPPAPPARASSGSDYADPRGFTIGAFYWFTGPGSNPDIKNGHLATDNETLNDLGRYHRSPGFEISFPITRTGSLHLEAFETKGDGDQIAASSPIIFTNTQFNKGDYLASQYQIRDVKFYLDDLLFPHSFPVRRFRLKSLWAIQYLQIHANVNSALAASLNLADDTRKIVLPTFGLAAEYQLAPHLLFRLEGSGFGLYKRADFWDAAATLAWRRGHFEFVGGGKAMHFKTSPQNAEFLIGTMAGAFVGARWHF